MTEFVTLSETPIAEAAEQGESLLARLARGDSAAVGDLYDRHHGAVRAFARRLLGDDAAAEDLVHDVFVALPRAAARYRGDSSLRTFLIAIAVNHARHHVRSAVRRRRALERMALEPQPQAADVEKSARQKELAEALTRALDRLPVEQRVAFVLCEVEERSSREAGEIAGAPEATIRTRLFHAKKRLRALLEAEATP